jgi:hypothetical protein
LLGDHSEREPPDPIPNSEVKPLSADDSVAVCHAKVGHCQAPIQKPGPTKARVFFCPRSGRPRLAAQQRQNLAGDVTGVARRGKKDRREILRQRQ